MFILAVSSIAFSKPVDGKIIYKLPSGDLVTRSVTLEVPSRGQGDVVLYGEKFEWRTKKFKTIKKNGRTIFVAAFKTEFMSLKSTIIFKGTYLKGANKLMYYGDMYKKKGHVAFDEKLSGFSHNGGFMFSYDR